MKKLLLLLPLFFLFTNTVSAAPLINNPPCSEWNLIQAGYSCSSGVITAAGTYGAFDGAFLHSDAPTLLSGVAYNIHYTYTTTAGTGRTCFRDGGCIQTGITTSGTFNGIATPNASINADFNVQDSGGGNWNGTISNLCIDTDGSCVAKVFDFGKFFGF